MAKSIEDIDNDDMVQLTRMDSEALGRLYELYYPRIFRFCVYRLFNKETAEDVTSTIFLEVARRFRSFAGRNEEDFRNWIYAIAVNQTNAFIRKTSHRQQLLEKAASSMRSPDRGNDSTDLNWPTLYQAILKLKPGHQTIVTLRFFEKLSFEEIGQIINTREATVRVTLHRILKEMRNSLQSVFNGDK